MRRMAQWDGEIQALELQARRRLYGLVQSSPGIHMREIQRRLGLAIGNLDYHLRYLEREGLVRSQGAQGRKLFFVVGHDRQEVELLGLLRQGMIRAIVLALARRGDLDHKALAREAGCSPSSLTYYMRKIEDLRNIEGSDLVVVATRRGRATFYRLQNPALIARLLIAYKESFLDRLVDNFVDSWEG